MKIQIPLLLLLALVGANLGAGAPDDIRKLVQTRSRQIVETERRFTEDLETLKAKYTETGDTDSVNLLLAIEENLRSGASGAAKDRHWIWHSGGELVLRTNGEATHTKWGRRGTWSLNQDGSIRLEGPGGVFRITFSGGEGHVFHLGSGGRTTITPKPESAGDGPSIGSIIRNLPETITPLTAQQLEEKVPKSYYFDYGFEPQPGKRIWRRIDSETWHEIYPNGQTSVFKVLGHTKIAGTEGTMVVRWPGPSGKPKIPKDGGLQAFIPDLGSAKMHHWYRNTARGDTKWNDLAPMKDVE